MTISFYGPPKKKKKKRINGQIYVYDNVYYINV